MDTSESDRTGVRLGADNPERHRLSQKCRSVELHDRLEPEVIENDDNQIIATEKLDHLGRPSRRRGL